MWKLSAFWPTQASSDVISPKPAALSESQAVISKHTVSLGTGGLLCLESAVSVTISYGWLSNQWAWPFLAKMLVHVLRLTIGVDMEFIVTNVIANNGGDVFAAVGMAARF